MTLKRLTIGSSLVALLLAGIAVGVWWFLIRSDAPPPVTIEAAAAAAAPAVPDPSSETGMQSDADTPGPGSGMSGAPLREGAEAADPAEPPGAAGPGAPDPAAADVSSADAIAATDTAGGIVGTWQVLADGRSFAGYRVQEELARIGANTAVGRTNDVSGTLVFDGSTVTEVQIEIDLSTLRSDDSRRDRILRTRGLEWGTYPTARFVMTEPIPIETVPADGESLILETTGELTLHGVTRLVTITIEGQIVGPVVAVVGSLEVEFADYGIVAPTSFLIASIEDHGVLEFQLLLERS